MRPTQLVLAGLWIALASAAAAAPDTTSSIVLDPAKLTLSITADGSPADVACNPKVTPAICPILLRAVSAWKFKPGQRDGHATAMNVDLTLNIAAVPKAGGYGIQATRSDLRLSPPSVAGALAPDFLLPLTPPRYPLNDQMASRAGLVVLELLLQPGSDQPRIGQIWLVSKPATEKR